MIAEIGSYCTKVRDTAAPVGRDAVEKHLSGKLLAIYRSCQIVLLSPSVDCSVNDDRETVFNTIYNLLQSGEDSELGIEIRGIFKKLPLGTLVSFKKSISRIQIKIKKAKDAEAYEILYRLGLNSRK